ncbi:ArsR family transcriptional regulator [Pandoraea horticolens]|uniref:ArsR family transcriptional regulator n=1 Tax=Pandoraea horticolens TaxID=2508298 RepID=A0A5E4XEB1_9BURK|nr:helix-turn-helix transcriptional regulator [Pandoraea horticolens]VVE34769.1 ArsR family transcriptional regulator [Pandoraea horticolens]
MSTYHPTPNQMLLEEVLAALGHPIRMSIVCEMAASPGARTCGSFPVSVTKATTTHHWRVLRESGITRERRDGRTKLIELRREELEARFPGLLTAVLNAKSLEGAPQSTATQPSTSSV